MGRVVEMVDLRCGCRNCGKIWSNHNDMIKDDNTESDMDYDQLIYFHKCNK